MINNVNSPEDSKDVHLFGLVRTFNFSAQVPRDVNARVGSALETKWWKIVENLENLLHVFDVFEVKFVNQCIPQALSISFAIFLANRSNHKIMTDFSSQLRSNDKPC